MSNWIIYFFFWYNNISIYLAVHLYGMRLCSKKKRKQKTNSITGGSLTFSLKITPKSLIIAQKNTQSLPAVAAADGSPPFCNCLCYLKNCYFFFYYWEYITLSFYKKLYNLFSVLGCTYIFIKGPSQGWV